jgi:hypothetical protein
MKSKLSAALAVCALILGGGWGLAAAVNFVD